MELIGSLTRDIRSLCVVIHLPVQEKLEHKFKMQSFLNIGKELVNLRDL